MESDKKFNVYKGEWVDDQPNGKGIMYYYHTTIIMEGLYKDGVPESGSNFKIRYPNGDIYEG